MSLLRCSGVLPGLLAAAVFIAGCGGGTVIGTEKIEETLKANFEHAREEKVSSVECPTDQKVEPKATFECTIKLKGGGTKTETLEIENDKADVHVVGLQGEASGANE
jgi:hypothetical protein